MDELHLLLQNKKIRLNLILIALLVILLPIGILLVRQAQVYFSRADAKFIEIAEGNCVTVRKGVKVLTCAEVPLKLINPFLKPSATPTPTPTPTTTGSATPTPSGGSTTPTPSGGSVGPPKTVRVNGNTGAAIQAALDSIKSTGGAVYVPAGTYTTDKKIRLFSNTTLFGDGIDQTIINATSALGADEAAMGNDTAAGQKNVVIRDMTVRGYQDGNGEVIKLRNLDGGFIYKVKAERANNGILLGFHNGKGVTNFRISECQVMQTRTLAIFMSLGENNVIDKCTVDSGGSDSLGIGLEIGVEGKISNNRVLNNSVSNGGHSYSLTAGNDLQYDPSWINSDNIVCYNTAQNNNIQPIWDQRGKNNVYVGNNVKVENINSFGFTEKSGSDERCNIPSQLQTIPPAPQKPSASITAPFLSWIKKLLPNLEVFAQDCVPGNPFHPCTTPTPTPTPTSSPTPSPSITPQPTENPQTPSESPQALLVYSYRLSESEADLEKAEWKPFGSNPNSNSATDSARIAVSNFTLSDETPGPKQIWAQFRDLTGKTIKDHITFNLAEKDPEITSLNCTYDLARQNVKVALSGKRFGQIQGNVAAGTNLTANDAKALNSGNDILNWSPEEATFLFKSGDSVLQSGQSLKVGLIREDDARSALQYCLVDQSSISLGARVFCREPGKFDFDNVKVSIFYNPDDSKSNQKLSRVDETVTISKDGFVQGLKTKLQSGKNYTISIQAPNSLRRNADFTASDGTTIINSEDGDSFILPIGDIAPVTGLDGQINSLDRSEIVRQWRILGDNTKKTTGDFNRDGKVNSIDWACMRYDFNSEDDPLPTSVSVSKSGQNSPGNESTITNTIISE